MTELSDALDVAGCDGPGTPRLGEPDGVLAGVGLVGAEETWLGGVDGDAAGGAGEGVVVDEGLPPLGEVLDGCSVDVCDGVGCSAGVGFDVWCGAGEGVCVAACDGGLTQT